MNKLKIRAQKKLMFCFFINRILSLLGKNNLAINSCINKLFFCCSWYGYNLFVKLIKEQINMIFNN